MVGEYRYEVAVFNELANECILGVMIKKNVTKIVLNKLDCSLGQHGFYVHFMTLPKSVENLKKC